LVPCVSPVLNTLFLATVGTCFCLPVYSSFKAGGFFFSGWLLSFRRVFERGAPLPGVGGCLNLFFGPARYFCFFRFAIPLVMSVRNSGFVRNLTPSLILVRFLAPFVAFFNCLSAPLFFPDLNYRVFFDGNSPVVCFLLARQFPQNGASLRCFSCPSFCLRLSQITFSPLFFWFVLSLLLLFLTVRGFCCLF